MKQDCDVSFTTPPASSAPAAVTGLVFLQVPAYPEVFRDGLHTFKLNEQDTDVRAALPAPSDHDALMLSSSFSVPLWGFSSISLSLVVAFQSLPRPLIRTTNTEFRLRPPPSLSLFGFGTTLPSPLTLALCFYTKLLAPTYSSGIWLGRRLRLC